MLTKKNKNVVQSNREGIWGNPGEPDKKSVPQENITSTFRGTGGSEPLEPVLREFWLEPLQAEPGLGKNKSSFFFPEFFDPFFGIPLNLII